MIFTGDLASPTLLHTQQLKTVFGKNRDVFQGKTLICNFEGLINKEGGVHNEPVLYNHPSVINALVERGPVVACLANNHILDLPDQYDETIRHFHENGAHHTGAGKSRAEAERPAVFEENGKEVLVFNACWDFLLYNHKNPEKGIFVAEINENELIAQIIKVRKEKPNAAIVVVLHWNFDLETLPFPMHRQFSRSLIGAGADLVAGHHAHCVQGGERYKDGYIVYGLGNFFIPQNAFAGGKLAFPVWAKTELILEWDPINKKTLCHWFEYQHQNGQHELIHLETNEFEACPRLKFFSPYREMNDAAYLTYFKAHRRKKRLIPVFTSYKNKTINQFSTRILKLRARFARFLAKRNVIKWQQ